jgi:ankyrin repeat protein
MDELNDQLLKAVVDEDLAMVKQLVQAGADVNYFSSKSNSPLLAAIDTMNVELTQFLLDQGANPNPHAQKGYTLPLNAAVDVAVQAFLNEEAASISNETVELLVQYKADYTRKDKNGLNAAEMARNYNSVAGAYFSSLARLA